MTRVYGVFKERFPSPQALAQADDAELKEVLGGLGLAWRLPLLRQLACEILRLGHVPDDERELRTLPGVGPYAAAAYLSLHRGKRAVLIDANIVRWLCRMTGQPMDGETRRRAWVRELVNAFTPKRVFKAYNYGLLDFTMTLCGARPRCSECPLRDCCEFGREAVRSTR